MTEWSMHYSAGIELATPPIFYAQHISGHHLSWQPMKLVNDRLCIQHTHWPVQDDQHEYYFFGDGPLLKHVDSICNTNIAIVGIT